jgi:superfamily II DNA helicase RecQ
MVVLSSFNYLYGHFMQLPAFCSPGLAVVFSPLLSLMQDQVDAMTAIGIRAVCVN